MRAVVVGTGFGCITHVPALRDAGFEVAALVGRDPAKTQARADRFDVPHACTSLAEALALDGIDAVSVVTPPKTHHDLVLEAVSAGKHVVCEKPFAGSTAEARAMLDAAEAAGVVHLLGTEFRFAPAQELLRRVVTGGEIGEPRLAVFLLEVPLIADHGAEVPDWWEDRDADGGWLGAYGSHVVDQVRTTLGEIIGVSASLPVTSGRPMTAEDTFTVHFRTANGATGLLHSTAGTWGPPAFLTRVSGTAGAVTVEGDAVTVHGPGGARAVEVPEDLRMGDPVPPPADLMKTAYDFMHAMGTDRHPYARLYGVLRDRIQGRDVPAAPPVATFADGVAGMAVLDAIRRSDAERRWVDVDG